MIAIPTQRQAFIKDLEEAQEELCLNLAHINTQESIDNIMHILVALRIAAIVYDEHTLQKSVEEVFAMMINHDKQCDQKTVQGLYELIDIMIYPYRNNMIRVA